MLPSSGYFKAINCPFYSSGLCERPHCHYRHVKREEPPLLPPPQNENKMLQLQYLNDRLKRVQDEVSQLSGTSAVGYVPTPKRQCVAPAVKAPEKRYIPAQSVPQYRPTPLSELRKRQLPPPPVVLPPPAKKVREPYEPASVSVSVPSAKVVEEESGVSDDEPEINLVKEEEDAIIQMRDRRQDAEARLSKDENDEVTETTSTNGPKCAGDGEKAESSNKGESAEKEEMQPVKENPERDKDNAKENDTCKDEASKDEEVLNEQSSSKSSSKHRSSSDKSVPKDKSSSGKPTPKDKSSTDKSASKGSSSSKEKPSDKSASKDSSSSKEKSSSKDKRSSNHKSSKDKSSSKNKSSSKDKSSSHDSSAKEKTSSKDKSTSKEKSSSNGKSSSNHKSSSKDMKGNKSSKSSDKSSKSTEKSRDTSSSKSSSSVKHSSKSKNSPSSKDKSHSSVKSSSKHSSSSSRHRHQSSSAKSSSSGHKSSSKHKSSSSHKSSSADKSSTKNKTSSSAKPDHHKRSPHKSSKSHRKSEDSDDPAHASPDSFGGTSDVEDSNESGQHGVRNGCVKEDSLSRMASPPMSIASDDLPEWDSDEDETYQQCLKIFQEEAPAPKTVLPPASVEKSKQEPLPELPSAKKRVAHQPELTRACFLPFIVDSLCPRNAAPRPFLTFASCSFRAVQKVESLRPYQSPAQALHNRFAQIKERYAGASNGQKAAGSAFVSSVLQAQQEVGKKRIAHVPNAALLAVRRNSGNTQTPQPSSNAQSSYVMQTQPKGTSRVAHTPAVATSGRPTIPAEYGSKVPTAVRQRYLNLFIDECLKKCSSEERAYEKALKEESSSYERSSSKAVYVNVVVNTLKRLRREVEEGLLLLPEEPQELQEDVVSPPQQPAPRHPPPSATQVPKTPASNQNRVVSHEFILGGAMAARTSFSIERNRYRKPQCNLTLPRLYKSLEAYLMTSEQLEENCYPRPHPSEPGRAVITVTEPRKYSVIKPGVVLRCSRCGTPFALDFEKNYVQPQECVYHWGRLWKRRIAGAIESRYSCCQGDAQAEGCCVGQGHVHEGPDPNLRTGFVQTLPKSPPPDGCPGVYALDCEMCYTTEGLELTRVTVVNMDLKPVYETLVVPENKILDYNTRFSGISENDLAGETTTLRQVQAVLLSLFSDRTILLGHSLESDFRALKLIHSCVVDTAVVFPHRLGPPFKRALRTIMAECLRKIIQNGVEGHDSQEDAVACMELMLWKVKEDLKKEAR
ncbi:RNA exonuclease 1 homolog [Ornithodoros turicata]|uniref:RNA exonuclease 1 homolog n=1 Tax=Ornithodoros turicata TaxID=34597 RepID=UPI00313A2668